MYYTKAADEMMEKMAKGPHHKAPMDNIQRFSKGEVFALNFLQGSSAPQSAGEIATALNTSSARVASLLNSLESKGYIERCMDQNDRRKILVAITEEGKETIQKATNMMRNHLSSVFKQMGEHDTKEFLRLTEMFLNLMVKESK